ncbi:hypothetical protein HGA13_32460 [Nocardia speluncae]|uniref:Uncharacterized protein n=1 Tax=Nocardia speluncae TaxID=419477 RepID=A0A846XN31_9NOCA|nr:hypothetical protein [Nocardia speluncae]NKY37748.1 hypothetical protein [Nocardia speluncae]
MNRSHVVPAVDLAVAVLAIGLAALCWARGLQTTDLPATGDYPAYTATRYVAPWLFLAGVLVTGAGLAVIDAVARLLRPARARADRIGPR